MTSSAAGALLNNIPTRWAVPLAAYLGLLTYDATSFCATDPPADPGITALDIAAIIASASNPLGAQLSLNKLAQLVSRYAWYQLCQCDTVATPAPPAPPAEPAGAPDLNPPTLPAPTVSACLSKEGTVHIDTTAAGGYGIIGGAYHSGSISSSEGQLLPSGATRIDCHADASVTTPAGNALEAYIAFFNASGTTVSSADIVIMQGSQLSGDATFSIPATANRFRIDVYYFNGPDHYVGDVHATANVYCNGSTPTTPSSPCCPPDPTITAKLDQIMALTTLLQRQLAPFAYVEGTPFSASGLGEHSVDSPLLGLKIEVIAPSRAGRIAGDPDRVYDVGEVSLGDADGWFYTRTLDRETVVWTPKDAQLATVIGYSIPADVTATITPLLRET
jgi:hypothetical protein